MSPYEAIRAKYLAEPEDQPFEFYLTEHLHRGFIFCTPEFFIMGMPVTKADLESGHHPLGCSQEAPDCWYVSAMSGDMAKAWTILPYPLPWVAFERGAGPRKELRLLPLERMREYLLR